MRKLKRSIARANMKDAGIPHINRKKMVTKKDGSLGKVSFFSQNWKNWVAGNPLKRKGRKKKVR